jgi:hypothetical protein
MATWWGLLHMVGVVSSFRRDHVSFRHPEIELALLWLRKNGPVVSVGLLRSAQFLTTPPISRAVALAAASQTAAKVAVVISLANRPRILTWDIGD